VEESFRSELRMASQVEVQMFYVYLLRSKSKPSATYIGLTEDLRARMESHNSGTNGYTSKNRPWNLVTYLAFSSRQRAAEFERYLKHGSGHAFARRHLW
jgi:putative endonuclease